MVPFAPAERKDTAVESLKIPPHSTDAEQAVLGGLMLDNSVWEQVLDVVTVEDFYHSAHRTIFAAIGELAERDSPYDVVTLRDWLDRCQGLDEVGGLPYLAMLARDTPSAANVRAYAYIVRERAMLRRLIQVSSKIADSAYYPQGRSSQELVDQAEQQVFAIANAGARRTADFSGISELLAKAVDRIDSLFQLDSPIPGLATGWHDFDEMTAGLQRGDLVIVAGRPSMGKTTFAINIAQNVCMGTSDPVVIFSMEMPGEQLAMRMLSSMGRIDQHRIRTGKLENDDWPRLTSALELLNNARLFIDDSSDLSPSDLRTRARRLAREQGPLGLVVVDYIQLMRVVGFSENRTQEVSEISRSLKALAKELKVPVVALSQLNRSLEQRADKRPVMSDLRESGAIEQDADLICFIYRDEVYHPDSGEKGTAEIIIGKQRNGPIGTVKLTFRGQFTSFENFAPDSYGDHYR